MSKIKVHIADDNEVFIKMIEEAIRLETNIEVTGISYDGFQLLETLKKNEMDILLLDLVMPHCDGLEVINTLKINNEYRKPKQIIVVSNFSNETLQNKLHHLGVTYFLKKPLNISHLVRLINDLYQSQSTKLILDVSTVLKEIGIPIFSKGYIYLRDAILTIYQFDELNQLVNRDLFSNIAKKYNSTSQRVDQAIRHAIEAAWKRIDMDEVSVKYGFIINKPSNKEFMLNVVIHLKNHHSKIC